MATGTTPFRVVIVCDFGQPTGGASQVALLSALGLAERGIPVDFVYAIDPLDDRLRDAGVTLHRIPVEEVWKVRNPVRAAVQGIWNTAAGAALAAHLKGFQPAETIVHFHQWTKAFSPAGIAHAVHAGYATAITMHDYFLACPNGALYNFRREEPCGLKPLSAACVVSNCDARSRAHKAVRLVRGFTQGRALSRLDPPPSLIHVSAFSQGIADPLVTWAGSRHVVDNPAPIDRPPRAAPSANRAFVFLGRLVPEKGCVEFARAARQAGAPALFIGSGPLEAAVRAANPDAELVGWMRQADAIARLRDCRALVFPSKWFETSGLVSLEAAAHGLPVLASACTAAAREIEDGVTGLVFPPGDIDALAGALRLMADDALVERLSLASYDRYWAAPRTVARHIDQLVTVYRQILAARAPLSAGHAGNAPAPSDPVTARRDELAHG